MKKSVSRKSRRPAPSCRDHLRDVRSRDADRREAAANALASALDRSRPCDRREVVLALAELLADPELNVRLAANRALLAHGKYAAPAVPALVEALKDLQTSGWVPTVLAEIGEPAVPALTPLLDDPRPHVRRSAAFTLGAIGKAASSATPTLQRLARADGSWLVRRSARWALVSIHGVELPARRGQPIIGEMIRGLGDQEDPHQAVTALANQGARAVPALIRALDDRRPRVRRAAAEALGSMYFMTVVEGHLRRAVPRLERLAQADPDPEVRRTATWALEYLGP